MRRTTTLASLLAVVALLGMGFVLMAADTGSSMGSSSSSSGMSGSATTSTGSTGASTGTMSPSTKSACQSMSNMSEGQIVAQDQASCKAAGMSDTMMMRRKMLMGMQISADDPGAVLALKSDLNLTQDQTDKVQKVQDSARKDTRDALTDSQRQQIAGLEGTPQSMVAMCREMSQRGWTGGTAGAATTGTTGAGASGSMSTGTTGTYGTSTGTTGTTRDMSSYESGNVHAPVGTTTGTTGSATATTGTYGATATPSGASATGKASGSVSAGTGTATGTAGTAGTNVGNMSESQMMAQDQAGCKAMGMSDPMQMRRKMLMGMQVSTDDPSAILALKSDLNLTQDQVDKIQKIEDNARKCTRDILNDSQKQQLSSLEGTPQSMVSMCRQMAQQGWISGTPGATPSTGAVTGTTGTYGTGAATSTTGTYGTGAATGTTGTMSGTSTGTSSTSSGTTGTRSSSSY